MANNYLYSDKTLITKGFHGYNVKFCPFDDSVLGLAGAENFGIKGNGCLILFDINAKYSTLRRYIYSDALFDFCWTKCNRNILLTGAGNGCLQIWSTNSSTQAPIKCQRIHHKEISSIDCPEFNSEYIATSSWDSSVSFCNVNTLLPSCVLRGHNGLVYQVAWSHIDNNLLSSVSEDGVAMLWSPFTSNKPNIVLPSVGAELLSCNWSFSDVNLLATASADAVIYGWDVRSTVAPLFRFHGHENAIRKVCFSPFISTEVVTVSYDFTTRLWDISSGSEASCVRSHTEFVYGVDYSLITPGLVADCSWDQTVQLYRLGPFPGFPSSSHNSFPRHAQTQSEISAYGTQAAAASTKSKPLPPLPDQR